MRYPASDKAESIRLVEKSRLPVRRTLEKLGVSPGRRFIAGTISTETAVRRRSGIVLSVRTGSEAIRGPIVDLALERPELSPRDLAVCFTDEKRYFVSEASVYRPLKAHDLITSRL